MILALLEIGILIGTIVDGMLKPTDYKDKRYKKKYVLFFYFQFLVFTFPLALDY